MSAIVILPEYAPPPPDWLGVVSIDTVDANNPQDFQIHYVSIVNDGTFGNILYTEPVSYPLTDNGGPYRMDASFDWGNDRLIVSYSSNTAFGSHVYMQTYQRLTGATVFQSTTNWPGTGANRPNGVTINLSENKVHYGYNTIYTIAYPFATTDIAGNTNTDGGLGVAIQSFDIDKNDENFLWTFEAAQVARKFQIGTGAPDVLNFSAGGYSGASGIAHGWDGMIYTGFDSTSGGGLAMHADDGSSGGTPINSKTNVLGSLPGFRNIAGVFAWNPAVPKPF